MKRQGWIGVGVGLMIGATLLKFGGSAETNQALSTKSVPTAIERQQVEQWLEANGYALVKKSDWKLQQEKIEELEAKLSASSSPTAFSVYINPGLSVSQIERLLVNSGLLPKENRFFQVIAERGVSRSIQTGMYTFKQGQTEEEIVDQLTN